MWYFPCKIWMKWWIDTCICFSGGNIIAVGDDRAPLTYIRSRYQLCNIRGYFYSTSAYCHIVRRCLNIWSTEINHDDDVWDIWDHLEVDLLYLWLSRHGTTVYQRPDLALPPIFERGTRGFDLVEIEEKWLVLGSQSKITYLLSTLSLGLLASARLRLRL